MKGTVRICKVMSGLISFTIATFAIVATLFASQSAAATIAIAEEVQPVQSERPINRLKQNDVLDTWKYYFCFANPTAHNHGPYAQTYRSLAFRESYARGKDKVLSHVNTYGRCLSGHSGAEYKYQATYYTW